MAISIVDTGEGSVTFEQDGQETTLSWDDVDLLVGLRPTPRTASADTAEASDPPTS